MESGADLLTLPRTIAMPLPLPLLGATIAALVEVAALAGADKDHDQPATAMALISTLGVLTREHDGDLPTVWVPEPLLMRAPRLIDKHRRPRTPGLPATTGRHRRRPIPHLQKTLREDAARLRALIPVCGGGSRRSIVNTP